MNKIGGAAFFVDRSEFSASEIIMEKYAMEKTIICKGKVGSGESVEEAVAVLKQHGFVAVIATSFDEGFADAAGIAGLNTVEVKKRDVEDMFRTFAEKDTEASLIETDEGKHKVKLISGSLSKSYMLDDEN